MDRAVCPLFNTAPTAGTIRAFGPSSEGSSAYAASTHSHNSATRVARIDNFFDAECLRCSQRRTEAIQIVLNLAAPRVRIGRRFDVALISRLHAAFNRQRSPIARRPRIAQIQSLRVSVPRARDAVAAADQNRDPRHGRLIHRDQGARSRANRTRALGRGADQKSGIVDEIHHRNVKRIAKIDQPDHLVARRRVGRAAALPGIVGDHAHGITVEPRQPGGHRTPVVIADLEKRIAIENQIQDAPNVVAAAPVARDDRKSVPLRADPESSAGCGARRRSATRSTADKRGNGESSRTLLLRSPLRCPPRRCARAWISYPPSCSFETFSPTPRSTTGGPATKSWLDPRTITEKCDVTTRTAPNPATGPRHAPITGTSPSIAVMVSHAGFAGHVSAADCLDGLDASAAAGAVDQPDHRHAHAARELFGVPHFVADRSVGRAAAHREIVAAHHHRPSVDAPACPPRNSTA